MLFWFSYETARLLEIGAAGVSLLNVLGQLAASVAAVYLGFTIFSLACSARRS